MKIFIHIGLPKAASTSLQHLLNQSREDLLLQGAFVPAIGFRRDLLSAGGKTDGHDVLPLLALSNKRLVRFFDRIIAQAQAAGCDRIILSSENLSHPANLPDIENFVRFVQNSFVRTKRAEVRYILIDRQGENWLRSFYNEQVMNGRSFESRTFEQFSADMKKQGISTTAICAACERIMGEALSITGKIDISTPRALGEFAAVCGITFKQVETPRQRTSPATGTIQRKQTENQALKDHPCRTAFKNPRVALHLMAARLPAGQASRLRKIYRTVIARYCRF